MIMIGSIAVFQFPVIVHSFQKPPNVHYKTFIGVALTVSGQSLCIPSNLGQLLCSLQSIRGIGIYEEREKFSH